MSQQYPKSFKNCATCAYWGGNRDTDLYGQIVKCDSCMSVGKCLSNTSGWTNQSKQAQQNCIYWEKWSVLK